MTYVQIHKGKSLILLSLVVISLCVMVLIRLRPVGSAVFGSCTQARKAGYSSIPKSNHLYNPALDRNHNGYACE